MDDDDDDDDDDVLQAMRQVNSLNSKRENVLF